MTPTELLARQREMDQAATPGPWGRYALFANIALLSQETTKTIHARTEGDNHLLDAALIVAARNDRALLLDVVAAADNLSAEDDKDSEAYSPDRIDRCWDALRDALDALFAAWEEEQ